MAPSTMSVVVEDVDARPVAANTSIKTNVTAKPTVKHVLLHVGAHGSAAIRPQEHVHRLFFAYLRVPLTPILARQPPSIQICQRPVVC